ncbi:N-(5'-phosphoribosyl)anthranilate isomerase (PRAI) [Acetoanaerobium sticklandii]|uniref:N-(5'-phosphoribosyl)anthranilate isomerase n=1 Tax=Acetoanaerobium sticklandii (strain ATCC 12662 / DSM 519 / JCM 1433 / CCUG 9281 / NCIMB 10654 / HF) TaxID=499177 RepID=E3PTA7_ACESD|nr:phosphoribosylanthranilate isomerase [Acetoanaerobium sticklandii]CBH22111.1 N-(5'-phosphoribosyl)anthranilate isomerase (PRAI) [Acetoanaerobium sticklandii]
MSNLKIKICGLKHNEDIEYVNSVDIDYVGFVFVEKSSRFITAIKAKELKNKLSPTIKAVGVFVDKPIEYIVELANNNIIDMIQLHGNENEKYILDLKKITDKSIIKAFQVNSSEDLIKAEKSSADYILLDGGSGGSGICIDWSIIYELDRPFFLAGGLNADNVARAVSIVNPYAVDVSSGVEVDSKKDLDEIKKFVIAARR